MIDVDHLITRMIVGGAQENTLFSSIGLARLPDYRVRLVTGPETGSEGNLLEGKRFDFEVTYVPNLVRSINPLHDLRALADLYRNFSTSRPDIVHTHSSKAGVLGRMAARAARIRVVVHTLHSLVFHDYQPTAVNFTYRTIKRALVPLTDHYVSVSDNIRERAIAARIGRPEHHSTIRSGFLTDEFVASLVPQTEARRRLGLPTDRVVIGTVARLFPLKGHTEILASARRVVRQHPDALFVFVGSGPMLDEFQKITRDFGLQDNVRFVGRVAPEDIPAAFSAFDILAHASLREGLARVIPQGVLAGLPVVCYELDGSAEVVSDDVNGYLVAPRDTEAFADRLNLLIADESLRHRLSGGKREFVRAEWSVDEMVRRLDKLYRRLLASSAA
ncbi:MAG: glycosyltransferase [Acidimicrobiales bacterium]